MAESKHVDGDLIRADREAGLTQAEIALKHGVSQSTVSCHIHARDADNGRVRHDHTGRSTAAANGKTPGNGSQKASLAEQIAGLEALAASEWARLGLLDRLRLLISRGAA